MADILHENGEPIAAIVNGKMVEVQEVRHGRWIVKQGWVCPKCGRVYSPFTPMCFYCGDEGNVAISTTGTGEACGANMEADK